MSEPLALEALGVSKRYRRCEALNQVDLIARRGQLHGLLGPNGAGKTTLMRVLLGLIERDAGTVRLLGHSLNSTTAPIPDAVAGFVEAPAFYPYLSGRANLSLLARLDGGARAGRYDRVARALEDTGLASYADVAVGGYSSGMRQRLGLAAALLRTPQLLFLDEPTSSLDPAGARDVRALARRLADQGAAVVLSSHDMSEVEALCSALTVINRGRVAFSGTVDALRSRAPGAVHALQTSDDRGAVEVATRVHGVRMSLDRDGGLAVSADIDSLDAYVIALGRAGIAVRSLERRLRSLESWFLELTGRPCGLEAPTPATADEVDEARESLVIS